MTNSEFMNILNDDSLELTVERKLENIIEEGTAKGRLRNGSESYRILPVLYPAKRRQKAGKEKKADSAGNDKITEPPAADKLKSHASTAS